MTRDTPENINSDESKNRPDSPGVYDELKAILDKKESEKKEPQPLHASDSHIDYVIAQANAWEQTQKTQGFPAQRGQLLSLYPDSRDRKPIRLTNILQSKTKIVDMVKKSIPNWRSTHSEGHRSTPEPLFTHAKQELADMVHRVEDLQQNGLVRPETTDVFVGYLADGMANSGFSVYYTTMYGSNTEAKEQLSKPEGEVKYRQETEKQKVFVRDKLIAQARNPNLNGFVYFNQPTQAELNSIKDRIYIALDPLGEPTEGLKAWWQAIEVAGLQDELCFKLFPGSTKLDTIVVYVSENINQEKLSLALETFQRICPPSALAPNATDTGVDLGRGMSYGAEIQELVGIHQLLNSGEKISFGQLLAGLTPLAMQLGYKKCFNASQQTTEKRISLKDVASEAKQYLRELLICVDINPDTMVLNSRGGELPDWAKKLRGESLNKPRARVNLSA
ncbi:hypothetical protein H0W80_02315 [Candidatus Saccharibacteria bacterium]|nr:hypothetical protein [Candidatus Saccharibacteria bacterium]